MLNCQRQTIWGTLNRTRYDYYETFTLFHFCVRILHVGSEDENRVVSSLNKQVAMMHLSVSLKVCHWCSPLNVHLMELVSLFIHPGLFVVALQAPWEP